MGKEIVVDINPYQTRVVLMDNGSPSEIYIEQRGCFFAAKWCKKTLWAPFI